MPRGMECRTWLVNFKKGYKVTYDLVKNLQKKTCLASLAVTGETIKSIKGEVIAKGTMIRYWTKDTPRKEIAASSDGEKTMTTKSQTT